MFKYLMILLCFCLFSIVTPRSVLCEPLIPAQDIGTGVVDDSIDYNLLEFTDQANGSDLIFSYNHTTVGFTTFYPISDDSVLKYPMIPG